jgi:protein TonB
MIISTNYYKHSFSSVIAGVVTVFLFLLMMSLITVDNIVIKDVPNTKIAIFIQGVDPVIEDRPIDLEKLKPVDPVEEPLLNIDKFDDNFNLTNDGIAAYQPPVVGEKQKISVADGGPISIMKVAPVYPDSAARKGLEGYVDVRFSVTASGTTNDIVVVEAIPERIFNRAAIRAVKRWKYKPKTDAGVAVAANGIYARIRFALDN